MPYSYFAGMSRGDSSDDGLSNHSDSLSLSGHSDSLRGNGLGHSHGSADSITGGAWLFPTPELASESRRSSLNSDGSVDLAPDPRSRLHDSAHPMPLHMPLIPPKMPLAPMSSAAGGGGGNRRKSAAPKRAFEGMELERSRGQEIDFESGELQAFDLSLKKPSRSDDSASDHYDSDHNGNGGGRLMIAQESDDEAPVDYSSDKSPRPVSPTETRLDNSTCPPSTGGVIGKMSEPNPLDNNNKTWDV